MRGYAAWSRMTIFANHPFQATTGQGRPSLSFVEVNR
jgi:hypothetical protein